MHVLNATVITYGSGTSKDNSRRATREKIKKFNIGDKGRRALAQLRITAHPCPGLRTRAPLKAQNSFVAACLTMLRSSWLRLTLGNIFKRDNKSVESDDNKQGDRSISFYVIVWGFWSLNLYYHTAVFLFNHFLYHVYICTHDDEKFDYELIVIMGF